MYLVASVTNNNKIVFSLFLSPVHTLIYFSKQNVILPNDRFSDV